jgi:carbon-monoxide dehydrogenase iron sulfur subunit
VADNYTYLVTVHPEKCRGCRTCEMACSFSHENEFNPKKSRIRSLKTEIDGLFYSIPVACQQCEDAVCMSGCPFKAIYRDPETGAKLVNPNKCTGCRRCMMICPFGAPSVSSDKKISFKCDLCEGDPKCVKACPYEALEYLRSDKIAGRKQREGSQVILDLQKNTDGEEGRICS